MRKADFLDCVICLWSFFFWDEVSGTYENVLSEMEITLGAEVLNIIPDGTLSFIFNELLNNGDNYDIEVSNNPTGQSCTINNRSGSITGPVTNIEIVCTDGISFKYFKEHSGYHILF